MKTPVPINNTLPTAWRRRCNGKLYGLTDVHIDGGGMVRVWIREVGTNKGLHLPLSTLAKNYQAIEGQFTAAVES